MATPAPVPVIKAPKPKKVVQASGRGGSGNFRKVKEKSYTTEVSTSVSTAKKIIEVEIPRHKAAYTGRGGQGNVAIHVLEDGVFQRVMDYELGKVQAYREERDAKRRSTTRVRTYSQSKPSKSSVGSDELSSGASVRRSWASKSTVELTPHSPVLRDTRKSLRETLLAPLRTTFTRNNRVNANTKSVRSDSSSFFAGSSADLGYPTSPPMSPTSPVFDEAALSPASDDTYSAALLTPSNAEMFGELAGKPVPRRRSTGTHRSSIAHNGPAPMPSPTTPLPPLPHIVINGGRSSLPVPLPAVPRNPPPPMPPLTPEFRSRVAFMPMKSLRANPAPIVAAPMQRQLPTVASTSSMHTTASSSSAASSQDKLNVSERPGLVGNPYRRAPNRRLYNASIAARSMGHLPVTMDAREASFYDDSDVDRVDPFLAHLGGQHDDKSVVSLMPWVDAPDCALSSGSVSRISIPSFNDSQPDIVAA